MKVHIAVISHRHGQDVLADFTECGLDMQLYEYVRQSWEELFPDTDIPHDVTKAIEDYFETWANHFDPEFYETYEIEVGDPPGDPDA